MFNAAKCLNSPKGKDALPTRQSVFEETGQVQTRFIWGKVLDERFNGVWLSPFFSSKLRSSSSNSTDGTCRSSRR